jgi:hypothetical protein
MMHIETEKGTSQVLQAVDAGADHIQIPSRLHGPMFHFIGIGKMSDSVST